MVIRKPLLSVWITVGIVALTGLISGCGGRTGGRMTTEEFAFAVELLRTDVDCRDSRLKAYWGDGSTSQELVDAVLGHPTSIATLRKGESLMTFITTNGTVGVRAVDCDGLPLDAPKSLYIEVVNQIIARPQPDVDHEKLKSRVVAIKKRIDPVDSRALADEMSARRKKEDEQFAASQKYASEQSRKLSAEVMADRERKNAADQEVNRLKAEEKAREFAERGEQGRDTTHADRDYVKLRDAISSVELRKKFSAQYLDWLKRRAAHLGEQRRAGTNRTSVPLPPVESVESSLKSEAATVPVSTEEPSQ